MPMKSPAVNGKALLFQIKPSSATTKDGHELQCADVNLFTVRPFVLITYR
jgi:hypothetical protein